jgi:hypothetical protein
VRLLSVEFSEDPYSYSILGGILSIRPDGVWDPGNYTVTVTVEDPNSQTASDTFTATVLGYNQSPPIFDLPQEPWVWQAISSNGVAHADDISTEFPGADEQSSAGDLSFGGALDQDGRFAIDWSDYIKESSRQVVEVTDDGENGGNVRSHQRAIYIHQDDATVIVNPPEWINAFPGLAVDDSYRASGPDSNGPVSVDLSDNDYLRHSVPPIYNDPTSALEEYGTVSDFDPDDGSFTFDPRDDFNGLITFNYTFTHPGVEHSDELGEQPPDSVEWLTSNEATVFIHVGKAVLANLTIAGLDEEDEAVGDGAYIALNSDDDNQNVTEDRQELKGPIRDEDDLLEISIDYWLRDDAYAADYTAV